MATLALDVESLKSLRQRRGLSATKLSRLAHCHHSYVGQLEAGKICDLSAVAVGRIGRVADALHVPLPALVPGPAAQWSSTSWQAPESNDALHYEHRFTRLCFTVTRALDSYLLPEELNQQLDKKTVQVLRLAETAIPAWRVWAGQYRHRQSLMRDDCEYVQVIIAPEQFLGTCASHNREWVECIVDRLTQYNERTAVCLLTDPHWQLLRSELARLTGLPVFDKLMVFDETCAIVRPTRSVYLCTYDRPLVCNIVRLLGKVTRTLPPYGCDVGVRPTASVVQESAKNAVQYIQRSLRLRERRF